jgi:hypothetical protein
VRRLLLPVVGLAVGLAVAGTGCALKSFRDLTAGGTNRAPPERCGECHRDVYAEWSASAHARAYVEPRFVAATSDHAFAACLPCHAPDSLYDPGGIQTRDIARDHGVDCVACHLDHGALVGPLRSSAVYSPHPIRTDRKSYRTSALCGRCHEGTMAEWKAAVPAAAAAGAKQECQDCHMPAITRKVTQPDDALSTALVSMEKTTPQRRHRFDLAVLQGYADAAVLHAAASPTGVDLEVENRLPHALPTGDFGPSRIEARFAFSDAAGRALGESTVSWSLRMGSAIPAYGRRRGTVPRVAGAVRCAITLVRVARSPDEDLVLARTVVDLR